MSKESEIADDDYKRAKCLEYKAELTGDELVLYNKLNHALTVKGEVDRSVAISGASGIINVFNETLPPCWKKLATLYSLAYDYNEYIDTDDFNWFGDDELVDLAKAEFIRLFQMIADKLKDTETT